MQSDRMKLAAAVLFAMVVFGGCVALPPIPTDRNLLDIVADAKTSREAVLLKLGEPSGSFEAGRILTFRIGEDNDHGYFLLDRQVRWANTKYSLVLVFDDKGVLAKHSLVRIR